MPVTEGESNGIRPMSAARFFISGSPMIFCISACNRSTTGFGVFAGADADAAEADTRGPGAAATAVPPDSTASTFGADWARDFVADCPEEPDWRPPAARREFEEETGILPRGEPAELGAIKQPGGKVVTAWAFEGDADPEAIRSNTFTLEWPPKSGKQREFPEVDRAGWFTLETAAEKILKGQLPFLRRLSRLLDGEPVS